MTIDIKHCNIVIPAKNEAEGLTLLLPQLVAMTAAEKIIVVDDGSTDGTADICRQHGVTLISHPYSMGNGAAIKSGARQANETVTIFMDADGQHNPADIHRLLDAIKTGYDMAIGARDSSSQASSARRLGNGIYNQLASMITGHRIEDLTSGFRAVRTEKFREFLPLLPNGFSYPTTSTMAFFRAGYAVGYIPITANKRMGNSHINLLKDGTRFFLIIFKIGTLYSPLKIFLPISLLFFALGSIYSVYTLAVKGHFTNMSALLLSVSVLIFLIGLVSEQITALLYRD
ncbi:MAG TPA: glycosyltransferase family 2 protein [Gammaproteobacteria bacterium]|nr:glycosyltransferase family 2 protein [Gammaproteobacteria bacterium]